MTSERKKGAFSYSAGAWEDHARAFVIRRWMGPAEAGWFQRCWWRSIWLRLTLLSLELTGCPLSWISCA